MGQVAEVEDEKLRGTQRDRLHASARRLREIGSSSAYELKQRGPSAVADLLFIRRALRDSLRRTLVRFARELAGDRALG